MRVLILAPHPFYQERGTPIAVDLLIRALTERGDDVDLLTFHEGIDHAYERFRIYRIKPLPSVNNLRPGFSAKKIYCDIFMFFRFIGLMWKNKYDVVHAVEESAFMALLVCPLTATPFVYDIDSSMTTQLIDKLPLLKPMRPVLRFFESLPMRYAKAVVPMCDALADEAGKYRDNNIVVLKDVSLVGQQESSGSAADLRAELGLSGNIVMYIGNLESYQGIDLLLQSFSLVSQQGVDASLVIIGGVEKDIEKYRELSSQLGIDEQVYLLGPRPVGQIGNYMAQADVLVSPRTQGLNTPMKIYSYLDSGVAVLATRLSTHTQVMNDDISMLAEPDSADFSKALLKLLPDEKLRLRLATAAKETIQREHSYSVFRQKVHDLYARLERSK
ncbi:MAG: glycosyltransferase family 4 protein [Gammaproteobacteria bacterium]|nr:glycosyltransferase family 4 protein [Gammaproteobacteria bacterium]